MRILPEGGAPRYINPFIKEDPMTFWTRTVPGTILAFLMVIPLLGAAGNGDEASLEDFRDISTGGAD
ncbi:MAG: hypothetical protein V3T54_05600, partial [Acidobacteriota bacterium]